MISVIRAKAIAGERREEANGRFHPAMILETLGLALKSSGLLIWCIVLFFALLEIKQYYNIDVIPHYDSPVDDAYGAMKGSVSELFK